EMSCHFFFNDRYFGYDDGIYAALRLFELLQLGKTLDELLAIFPKKYSTREFRIACPDSKKNSIVQQLKDVFTTRRDAHVITIDGVRVTMPYGWGLVRASNTQAVLSIRFESDSLDGLSRIKQDFIELLQPLLDTNLTEAFNG
ncbi:MAG: phosphomannomutase, partial [bacterium]|nr:phosphomannomutase [bacterium]